MGVVYRDKVLQVTSSVNIAMQQLSAVTVSSCQCMNNQGMNSYGEEAYSVSVTQPILARLAAQCAAAETS
eukprot:1519220-Amphidinium_carterae.1